MVSRLEIQKSIENKLILYGLPEFKTLKGNIQEHLVWIESAIIDIAMQRNKCIEEQKGLSVNVYSVVEKVNEIKLSNDEKSKMSRQTIYNNREILESYILRSQEEFDKSNIFKEIAREGLNSSNKIKELNKIICDLQNRDLDEQFYLDKITLLEEENKNYKAQIKKLDEINADKAKKIIDLEKKLRVYEEKRSIDNNIMNFTKKNKN